MKQHETVQDNRFMQCIGFTFGEFFFGSAVGFVQEIIRPKPVIPLPNSPEFIEGVIIFRTNIIPLLDMRKRLNIRYVRPGTADSRFLILDIQGTVAGIRVDSVTGVHHVETSSEVAPDVTSTGHEEDPYVQKVCSVGELQMKILDFDRILAPEERDRLGSIMNGQQRII